MNGQCDKVGLDLMNTQAKYTLSMTIVQFIKTLISGLQLFYLFVCYLRKESAACAAQASLVITASLVSMMTTGWGSGGV